MAENHFGGYLSKSGCMQGAIWELPLQLLAYPKAIWEFWKQSGHSLNGIWELAGALGSQGWPGDDL